MNGHKSEAKNTANKLAISSGSASCFIQLADTQASFNTSPVKPILLACACSGGTLTSDGLMELTRTLNERKSSAKFRVN